MTPHAEKSYFAATGDVITGSIVRIYTPANAALADCSFGKFVEGGDDVIHFSTTDDIAIPEGTYLEGPIAYCETKTAKVIVYYNGSLSVS